MPRYRCDLTSNTSIDTRTFCPQRAIADLRELASRTEGSKGSLGVLAGLELPRLLAAQGTPPVTMTKGTEHERLIFKGQAARHIDAVELATMNSKSNAAAR